MEQIRIKLHSITDLITNSSTVIYTYSEGSLVACKEMVDEIFRVLGVDKKCDDVFDLSIAKDVESYDISETDPGDDVPEEFLDKDGGFDDDKIDELLKRVRSGGFMAPSWFNGAIKNVEARRDYPIESTLIVTPKSDEYASLAKLVSKFLYSTTHESCYNG